MATFRKGTGTVLSNGVPVANVTVSIYAKGTTTYATIYSDEGVTPIDQTTDPILSDSAGRYAFYLDVDTYAQFRIFLDPSTAAEGYNFDEANADLDGVSMPSTGAKGIQGEFGGDSFEYVFSDETGEADPGSGKLRYNHATPADATELYIDDEEANAVDIQVWLRTLDDSTNTNKGHLKVFKKDDSSKFATFNLTALSEEAGYFKLTVTCVASNLTFSDADEIVITFGATGDTGTDTDAIHDNVAAEISAIAEKTTIVAADMLVAEDSESSDAKKMVQVSNLFGCSEHIRLGAKSLLENIYPETWNAEFHNAVKADNNTIGTIAGGDGFEWIVSPNDADINTTILHALRVKTSKNDSDASLRIDIDPGVDMVAGNAIYALIYLPALFSTTSDENVGIRVENNANSKWIEVRVENDGAGNLRVKTYSELGETDVGDVYSLGPYVQEIFIALEIKSDVALGDEWRAWLSPYRVGPKTWTRMTGALGITNGEVADRAYLQFGASDDADVTYLSYGVGYVRASSANLY